MSYDCELPLGHNVLMGTRPKQPSATYRRKQFIALTKAVRVASGKTQEQVAEALGMKQDRYKNYETKRPLRAEMIDAFLAACEADPSALFPQASKRQAA